MADRTYNEKRELVASAVQKLVGPGDNRWVYVRDLTDEWAVYEVEGAGAVDPGLYRVTYTIADGGEVTLGTSEKVEPRTEYDTVTEAVSIPGRVIEAKADNDAGGRVFRVQIIEAGDSLNGRRYPHTVLSEAATLYEGAKAFDHHRTDEELNTSTVTGLVGGYRGVTVNAAGLEADLHLLPGATHVAEALDASLKAQAAGLRPLVGISHDAMAEWRPVPVDGGRHMQEATKIVRVLSADVVADPAAGGKAIRMVAGGSGDSNPDPEEGSTMPTFDELIELIDGASPEQRASLAVRLGVADNTKADNPATGDEPKVEDDTEKVLVTAGAESFAKSSLSGRRLVRDALDEAKLPHLYESVLGRLPDRFAEADVIGVVEMAQRLTESFEKDGLTPKVGGQVVTVGAEDLDKKRDRLDKTFQGNFAEGYHSIKQAYLDVTGTPGVSLIDGDLPAMILRESHQVARIEGLRSKESVTSSTWGEVLGDSIARRMVAEYSRPSLSAWKRIASVVPISDFRTQHVTRMGGYGALPTVAEGGPYTALTSPADEEATYKAGKKGGTEDLTLEAIANDDMRAVVRIPTKLGIAAAQTLYSFVFGFLTATGNIYDGVALFDVSHTNSGTMALSSNALGVARAAMLKQKAAGESVGLMIAPSTLIVPPELQQAALEIVTSTVKVNTNENATVANLNGDLTVVATPIFTDANDWYLAADPSLVPGIEVGFYQGRQDPELFVQSDPTSGAVFSNDKVTYKIRHIYGGAVVDYRGFYQSKVA